MAVAVISTAMISTCISNVLVSKLSSQAGSSIYNYLFKKKTDSIDVPIDEYIKRLDIKEKIIISKAFIESIPKDNCKCIHIISSLQDMIIEVEALLKVIELKKNKHKYKYFSSYRSLHLSKEQEKLITYDQILSKRLDYLIKLLSIM